MAAPPPPQPPLPPRPPGMMGAGKGMPPLPPGMMAAARPPPGSAALPADRGYSGGGSSSNNNNSSGASTAAAATVGSAAPLTAATIDRTRYLVPPGMGGAPPLPPMMSLPSQKPSSPQPPYGGGSGRAAAPMPPSAPPRPPGSSANYPPYPPASTSMASGAAPPPPPPGLRVLYHDYYNNNNAPVPPPAGGGGAATASSAPPHQQQPQQSPYGYGGDAPRGSGGYYASHYDGPDGAPPPPPQQQRGYPPPPPPGVVSPYARGGFFRSGGGGGRMAYEDHMPMREPTNTVWVGNLDPIEHNEEVLRREMREFGMIMRVAKQAEKSYCFVHYRRVEEARNAVETLSRRGSLGQAKFNYGKMFEYTPEEMALPYDPNAAGAAAAALRRRDERCGTMVGGTGSSSSSSMVGGGGAFGSSSSSSGMAGLGRRPRVDHSEPTNVLWVGSLPPTISDEKLREVFEVFGTVKLVSRMDKGGMAFVHFDTVEHCTLALQTMTGRPIEGGVVLALNYGHAPRPAARQCEPLSESVLASEVATNVVYMGALPADTTDDDVEHAFAAHEGFIFSKYIPSSSVGFGHFDTIDHARAARIAMHGTTLHGTVVRVSYGKNNHTYTMADRFRQHESGGGGADGALMLAAYGSSGADGEYNLDAMMRDPGELDAATGALVAGAGLGGGGASSALTLPARGGAAAAAAAAAERVAGGAYSRVRAAPELTLDVRLQTLLSTLYNECGAPSLELSPSQVQAICTMVDYCVDEATAQRLDETLTLYVPLKCVHVFSIVAKRMHAHYNDDPHKKLLVLYAVTRVLLGATTEQHTRYTSAALNTYLMVLLVASAGQTSSGVDRLVAILESLQHHTFIEKKANVSKDYVDEFRAQLDEVLQRARAEQDLSSLLTRRRRRGAEAS